MLSKYNFGLFAEIIAKIYLQICFYKILNHRYKSKFGEIDIIALKKNTIVAVEVKARNKGFRNFEIVSEYQYKRILNSIEFFISSKPKYWNYNIRIDLILIKKPFFLKHFKEVY